MKKIVLIAGLMLGLTSLAMSEEEINNGTNPTLLATTALVQYKYTDLRIDEHTGLFEAQYIQPIGDNTMSFTFALPYASGVMDDSYDLGDASVKFTHVFDLTKERGLAYTLKATFDTADRGELGTGQTTIEATGIYAKFLADGSIFAPALVHQFGLGDHDDRAYVNVTTLDMYYVPKLANPNYFITYDPAIVHDWERDDTYASLTVTLGMMVGKMFGGNAAVYIKPQILAGANRPVDWTLQGGFKVIGF